MTGVNLALKILYTSYMALRCVCDLATLKKSCRVTHSIDGPNGPHGQLYVFEKARETAFKSSFCAYHAWMFSTKTHHYFCLCCSSMISIPLSDLFLQVRLALARGTSSSVRLAATCACWSWSWTMSDRSLKDKQLGLTQLLQLSYFMLLLMVSCMT